MKFIRIEEAKDGIHKLVALFETDAGRIKKVKFGAKGYSHYTSGVPGDVKGHLDEARRQRYIQRHRRNENFSRLDSPGALSYRILWLYPSYSQAVAEYRKRFS